MYISRTHTLYDPAVSHVYLTLQLRCLFGVLCLQSLRKMMVQTALRLLPAGLLIPGLKRYTDTHSTGHILQSYSHNHRLFVYTKKLRSTIGLVEILWTNCYKNDKVSVRKKTFHPGQIQSPICFIVKPLKVQGLAPTSLCSSDRLLANWVSVVSDSWEYRLWPRFFIPSSLYLL